MSKTISIRLNEEERAILDEIAEIYDCGISSMIKKIVFEKLEDDFDMQLISEYADKKSKGELELYDHDQVWSKLDL